MLMRPLTIVQLRYCPRPCHETGQGINSEWYGIFYPIVTKELSVTWVKEAFLPRSNTREL